MVITLICHYQTLETIYASSQCRMQLKTYCFLQFLLEFYFILLLFFSFNLVSGKKECVLCGIQDSTCHRNVILPPGK